MKAPRGIIPPLVTPLSDRDRLDEEGLERLIEHLIAAGVDGIFVLGSSGEGPSLSWELRRAVVQKAARAIDGRVPLYVGILDSALGNAVDLAWFAADQGADAVVAAPPFYYPIDQRALRHWYVELAAVLPVPLVLYNIPSCTKTAIELETLLALTELENVIAIKDSSGDLRYLAAVVRLADRHRPDWTVLVGPEELLVQALNLGAHGGVPGGANLTPRLFVDLCRAWRAGDNTRLSTLCMLKQQLEDLYRIDDGPSGFLRGLKCALERTGLCAGGLAAPLEPLGRAQREQVERWLQSFPEPEYLPAVRAPVDEL